uniref:Secreted protein n=1 Tax=Achlya hypogyna TaxID=1202772 RepID=A0A0A7CN55_ACHHY|nr:secreted protein [Achlya hypogyna]
MVRAPFLAFTAVAAASDPFHWGPCPGKVDPRYECGALTVPLDHLNASNNATIDIAVQRYRTNVAKPLGTILINPGGPGGSGTELATPVMNYITGGSYDVLGFDPRGVGSSRPIRCAKDGFVAWQQTQAMKMPPFDEQLSDAEIDRYGSDYKVRVERCRIYDGDYLPYLSTAFVARDMDLIRAALGQDLMHYYGISYGTFLGQTYANMFPNKVGRFVIDSVVDAPGYVGDSAAFWASSILNIEDVFDGFASECEAAGPLLCPLADSTLQRPYLSAQLRSLVANFQPTVVRGGYDFVRFTQQDLRMLILPLMYAPKSWPTLAAVLHQLLQGSLVLPPAPDMCPMDLHARDMDQAGLPYLGNDATLALNTPESWAKGLRNAKKLSPMFGSMWMGSLYHIKYWTTTPVERFDGPWNQTLANKVLILSNEHDPVTPLRSAKAAHERFGANNSVLVVREGYGHCAAGSQPSACIHNLLVDYFNHGVYPTTTYCKIDHGPFAASKNITQAAHAAMQMATIVHKVLPMKSSA